MPEENQTMEEIHTVEEVETINEPTPSQTEIQTENKQKNTVATVGMRFSIIWLIAIISPIIGLSIHLERSQILLYIILLCCILVFFIISPIFLVWFILWVIGLFRKPRWRAWIAVCIPLFIFIGLSISCCYIWSCIKVPATEFYNWSRIQEQLNKKAIDDDNFQYLLRSERDDTINQKSADEIEDMFEASTWSSFLEKGSYLFSALFQETYTNALEKYNNWEKPEITTDKDDEDVDTDTNTDDENNDIDEPEEDTNIEDSKTTEQEEITIEEPKKQNNETFSQTEKNEIEQLLNVIE